MFSLLLCVAVIACIGVLRGEWGVLRAVFCCGRFMRRGRGASFLSLAFGAAKERSLKKLEVKKRRKTPSNNQFLQQTFELLKQ